MYTDIKKLSDGNYEFTETCNICKLPIYKNLKTKDKPNIKEEHCCFDCFLSEMDKTYNNLCANYKQ